MEKFNIVSVGDVTIDAFFTILESGNHFHLNSEGNELCIRYGEKIPVDSCDFRLGGNACNASVGFSRLGLKTALFAETGDDEFAQKILKDLSKENVDKRFIIKTPNAPSSFSMIINFKGERTIFVEHVKREHNFSFDTVFPDWVYLTSIGNAWKEAYKKTLGFVEKNMLNLAFNPGTFQTKEGVEVFMDVLKKTKILFVNKEEAEELLKRKDEVQNLLKGLKEFGPEIIVLTNGTKGSFSIDKNGKILELDIFPQEAIERTGAGDAYTSGFLAAHILGKSIEDAMKWGSINAASVISKIGAQPGLLAKEEIEKRLLEHKEYKANVVN